LSGPPQARTASNVVAVEIVLSSSGAAPQRARIHTPDGNRPDRYGAFVETESWPVRVASVDDADVVGRLLDDFNREFDTPTPGPGVLDGSTNATASP